MEHEEKSLSRRSICIVFGGLLGLVLAFTLSACAHPLLQNLGMPVANVSLPEVEITPPQNYTKGAPFYEMRFSTINSSMPGMVGVITDGASRTMHLRMISHPGPQGGATAQAWHIAPEGMGMHPYLPLLPPETSEGYSGMPDNAAKPEKMTLKTYWGCGEKVRQGQPRVLDTSKMASAGYMGGMGASGTDIGGGNLKPGWVEVLWPNKDDKRAVPDNASLVGEHFIHGNFLPHIKFTMGERHNIMNKLVVSAQSTKLSEAIPIKWQQIPNAIGYQVTAFGYNDARKEIIIWVSGEKPEPNVSGEFLDTAQVNKYISSKIIMPSNRDSCIIPKGIFANSDMVMVTVTAWGEDYLASYPPRPAKPPQNWKPDWSVKGQFISMGIINLGMAGGSGGNLENNINLGDILLLF